MKNAFKSREWGMADDEFASNKISYANIILENVSLTGNG